MLAIYTPLCGLFALVSAAFVLAVPAAAWRRVTAICLVVILFPNVANDYKLCCLLPGLFLLLMSARYSRRDLISLSLFCLLMVPKSYYFFKGHSIAMFINPVLLISLAWQVMADRDAWRRGRRLLPFRALWYFAGLRKNDVGATWINSGRPLRFLSRKHPSLCLD